MAVALFIGVGAALFLANIHMTDPKRAADFDPLWVAARALMFGEDPYAAVEAAGWPWPLYYPLPAVLLITPLSFLPVSWARGIFVLIGTGALAYGLTRDTWWRLIVLSSGAYLWALVSGQWTPFLTAGALLPALRFAWAAKPTDGLTLLMLECDRRKVYVALTLMGVLTIISVGLMPTWPMAWLAAVRNSPHIRPPLLRPFGWVLLLAALRWRTPGGRLLLASVVLPTNTLPYQALPLLLLGRTFRETGILAGLTLAAAMIIAAGSGTSGWADRDFTAYVAKAWPAMLLLCYLPALVIVLRRSPTLERVVAPSY